ncbi:MAG: hypothetical protein LBR38_00270, partial [Synergistaceae bacterium]|nr:hypothetical protein [Synergistaceae bacterium]
DKITLSEFIGGYAHPNIGAFQVNEDTHRYITDVFRSLFFPWGYEVPERVLRGTERIIREKYGEREPFYLRFGLAQAFLLSGALSCAQAFRRSRASFTSSFRPSMRPWGIREILASFWCVRYVAFRLRGFTTEASLKERV